MTQSKVLIVEDEQDILELIVFNLEKAGFACARATTGEAGLAMVEKEHPDIIILDLMLPGLDGMSVCRRLREHSSTASIPVLMLTAKSEDSDIVSGLEVGADDYLTKPFSPRVLVARVKAILRRDSRGSTSEPKSERIELHGIVMDFSRHEAELDGVSLELSATEYAILEFLIRNSGWVFSRNKIIDAVKGKDYPVTERSVDVQILGLRKKLGEKGSVIETVRGVGYRMRSAD